MQCLYISSSPSVGVLPHSPPKGFGSSCGGKGPWTVRPFSDIVPSQHYMVGLELHLLIFTYEWKELFETVESLSQQTTSCLLPTTYFCRCKGHVFSLYFQNSFGPKFQCPYGWNISHLATKCQKHHPNDDPENSQRIPSPFPRSKIHPHVCFMNGIFTHIWVIGRWSIGDPNAKLPSGYLT